MQDHLFSRAVPTRAEGLSSAPPKREVVSTSRSLQGTYATAVCAESAQFEEAFLH